jgi:hypothetical protein
MPQSGFCRVISPFLLSTLFVCNLLLTNNLDKPAILQPHLTAASSGIDFQDGISDLPVHRVELAIRQLSAEVGREEYFCGEPELQYIGR